MSQVELDCEEARKRLQNANYDCCSRYDQNPVLFVCLQEAIALLEPMTNDPVNYVRQVRNKNVVWYCRVLINVIGGPGFYKGMDKDKDCTAK